MSKDAFESCLRENLERQPFHPFVVEFTDGRQLVIKQPPVVFCDGAARFIDSTEDALVEFFHDEVRAIGLWPQEVRA